MYLQAVSGGNVALYVSYHDDTTSTCTSGSPGGYTGVDISSGVWHHIVIVIDPSQASSATRLKLFVDGAQDTLTFSPGGAGTGTLCNTSAVWTWADYGNGANQWGGNVDEFNVWCDAASGSEVTCLYNSGVPLDVTTCGLGEHRMWMRFESDDGTTTINNHAGAGGYEDFTTTNMESGDFVTDVP